MAPIPKTGSGCSKRPWFSPSQPRRAKTRRSAGKAAVSEEARRTLRYVEPLSDTRTPLVDFFSILLNIRQPVSFMWAVQSVWLLERNRWARGDDRWIMPEVSAACYTSALSESAHSSLIPNPI